MTTVDTHVFVGGPADGRRQTILHGHQAMVRDPETTQYHLYRTFQIAGEHLNLVVWADTALTPDEVLAMLVEGYREGKT